MAKKKKKVSGFGPKKRRTAAQKAATAKMLLANKRLRKNAGVKKPKAKKAKAKAKAKPAKKRKARKNSAIAFPRVNSSSDWIPASGVKFQKQANGDIRVLLRQD